MSWARRAGAALLAIVSGMLAGCAEPSGDAPPAAAPGHDPTVIAGEVVVLAAASLTDALEEIGAAFETANPGTDVIFSFGPSSGLATQIVEGAPADVAAFASEVTMDRLAAAGAVAGQPQVFATNDLVVVTPAGNPEGIAGVEDLTDSGTVALCGADVPCGVLAQEVLDTAGVEIPETSVTRGEDARSTLAAVSRGDAAAGVVYRTDAAAAGDDVEVIAFPAGIDAVARYPVAGLADSRNAAVAAAFVEFVLSAPGRRILADHGFGPAP
ncbi:MAG: molybdate ABC transporter substrate-binding protein [Kineosporiaceae bacterium]